MYFELSYTSTMWTEIEAFIKTKTFSQHLKYSHIRSILLFFASTSFDRACSSFAFYFNWHDIREGVLQYPETAAFPSSSLSNFRCFVPPHLFTPTSRNFT